MSAWKSENMSVCAPKRTNRLKKNSEEMTYLTQANSLRRTAKEKKQEIDQIGDWQSYALVS